MNGEAFRPIRITSHFYQLGTPSFPAYLSVGETAMLIEGGTGPTYPLIVAQLETLGIDPAMIGYVVLPHTHPDHIGAVPHLKRAWPHLKVLASPAGAKVLGTRELHREFEVVDLSIAQLMRAKAELDHFPAPLREVSFDVDTLLREGDRIELGKGIVWDVLDTPGHSPCHISLFEHKEGTLYAGDATGFYVPGKDVFWPNYFHSLGAYCDSIRKLSLRDGRKVALSHNGVPEMDPRRYLGKAMRATENYHMELLKRAERGEGPDQIAMDKARFVSELTDIQPFKVIYDMCRLLIKRSETNGHKVSFDIPGERRELKSESMSGAPVSQPEEARKIISSACPVERKELSLNERLGLISLIDEGMRLGLADAPVVSDLFNDLWDLVSATVSGAKINRNKPDGSQNGFRLLEVRAETGENLGRLNMLYLKKPIPCYYLVYVEVAAPFRKRGLGHQILAHFCRFLSSKSAVGLLDNIIPFDDPTYDIYLKHSWSPVEDILGESPSGKDHNYMVYIPRGLEGRDLKEPLLKLLYHLGRKRTVIDMRDNEMMVQRTIAEFKELYRTLTTYFEDELKKGESSPFMRFMFTRFVTKLIAFRRRIAHLVGYTGGETMTQVLLSPEVSGLKLKSYAPRELGKKHPMVFGDLELLSKIREDYKIRPARTVESLPNYRRPSLKAWLDERDRSYEDVLTIGDIMDLGFDPTRLKEMVLDGEDYIFERIQARQVPEIMKKNELLERIAVEMAHEKIGHTRRETNPALLILQDRGNAYVLRRKIEAIHWEEALEQLQSHPCLEGLNRTLKMDGMILHTVRKAAETITDKLGLEKGMILDTLSPFVSWDLKNNQPRMMVDFTRSYLESAWMA